MGRRLCVFVCCCVGMALILCVTVASALVVVRGTAARIPSDSTKVGYEWVATFEIEVPDPQSAVRCSALDVEWLAGDCDNGGMIMMGRDSVATTSSWIVGNGQKAVFQLVSGRWTDEMVRHQEKSLQLQVCFRAHGSGWGERICALSELPSMELLRGGDRRLEFRFLGPEQ